MSVTNQKKKGVGSRFKDIRAELSRVTWPTRSELINYTGIVIATCIFFAIFMGIVDAGFHYLLKLIIVK